MPIGSSFDYAGFVRLNKRMHLARACCDARLNWFADSESDMDNSNIAAESTMAIMKNVRMLVPIVGLASLWCLESFRTTSALRVPRLRHAARNLSLTILNTILMSLLFGVLTVSVAEMTQSRKQGVLFLMPLTTWSRLVLGVLLLDVWTWGWHWSSHRVPLLWRFHRVHHSDAAMDVTTAARFHIGELSLSALTKLPFILIFGVSPMTLLVHETLLVAVSQFHHSAISIGRFDRILRWLIVTPHMHRIHHSRLRVETNSNYASILSVWDRVFGTYRSLLNSPERPTGLDEFESAKWETLSGLIAMPLANDPAPKCPSPSGETDSNL